MSKKVSTSKQAGKAGQSSKQAKAEEQLIDSPLEQSAAALAPKKEVVAKATKAKGRKPVVPESRDDEVEERAERSDEEPIEVALDEGDAGGAYTVLTSTTTNEDQDKAAAPQDRSNTGVILAALGGLAALGAGSSSGPVVPSEPTDYIDIVRNENVFETPNHVDANGEIETTRLVRHVTAVSKTDVSETTLLVNSPDAPVRLFSSSRVTVDAQGDRSSSHLELYSTGNADSVTVKATGESSQAGAMMVHTGNLSGGVTVQATSDRNEYVTNEVQAIDLSNYVPRQGDVVTLSATNVEYTVQQGDTLEDIAAGLTAAASAEDIDLTFTVEGDTLVLSWSDGTSYGNYELEVDPADYTAATTEEGGEDFTVDEVQTLALTDVKAALDAGDYTVGDAFTLSFDSEVITYNFAEGDTLAKIVAGLNADAASQGLDLVITLSGTNMVLTWSDATDHHELATLDDELANSITATLVEDGGEFTTDEVQVIDLGDYELVVGDELTLSLGGGVNLDYTVTSTDVEEIIAALQTAIDLEGLDLTIAANFETGELTLTWTDGVDHPAAVLKVGESTFEASQETDGGIELTGDSTAAYLGMHIDGTIGTGITVNASGEESIALASIGGDFTVQGAISVTASGENASADLGINSYFVTVNGEDEGSVNLAVSSIEVLAQADDTDAHARIYNASGSAGDVTVSAEGDAEVQVFDFTGLFGQVSKQLASGHVFNVEIDGVTLSYAVSTPLAGASKVAAQLTAVVAAFNTQAQEAGLDVVFSESAGDLVATWTRVGNEDLMSLSATGKSADLFVDYLTTAVQGVDNSNAYLTVVADQEQGLALDSLTVAAIAEDGDAEANLSGPLTIKGDVLVSASGDDAEAYVHVNDANDVVDLTNFVGAGNITVEATESGASADLHLNNAAGSAGQLSVLSTANDTEASLSLETRATQTLSVEGLSVHAHNEGGSRAVAQLYVEGESGVQAFDELAGILSVSGSVDVTAEGSGDVAVMIVNTGGGFSQMDVDSIAITAEGEDTFALGVMGNLSGSVGDLSVTAAGSGSSADFNGWTESLDGVTGITASSLTITASESNAQALASLQGDVAIDGDVLAQALESQSSAVANMSGDVSLSGSIDVTSSGASAYAGVVVNGYVDLLSVGSPQPDTATHLDAGDISVLASGANAFAGLGIYNADGTAGAVSVSATESNSGASFEIGVAASETLTLASMTVSASDDASASAYLGQVSSDGSTLAITGDIHVTAEGDNASADLQANTDGELGHIHFEGGELLVTADGSDASASASIYNASGVLGDVTVDAFGAVDSSDSVSAALTLEVSANETLAMDSVSVTANSTSTLTNGYASSNAVIFGESGDAEDQWAVPGSGTQDVAGTVQIDGDISVTASGVDDVAALEVNWGEDMGRTSLGGGDLSVTAQATNTKAEAHIGNASGTLGAISVSAEGHSEVQGYDFYRIHSEDAGVYKLRAGDKLVFTINGITLESEFTNTEIDTKSLEQLLQTVVDDFNAQIELYPDQRVSFGVSHQFSSDNVFEGLVVNWERISDEPTTSVALVRGVTTVGTESLTSLPELANETFQLDGTTNSNAYLDLYTGGEGVTADTLSVSASAEGSAASGDIMGDIAIQGDISVMASGLGSGAHAIINITDDGLTVLGADGASGDLNVGALDHDASASLVMRNALGQLNDVDVRAEGDDTDASLSVQVEAADKLTISTLTVEANSNYWHSQDSSASADAYLAGEPGVGSEESGTVEITGDITVSAIGESDTAILGVNDGVDDGSSHTQQGGGNVTVTASGDFASADAHIQNTSGTAGALSVTASGESADAYLNITTESFNSVDGLSALNLSVTANGESSDAGAFIMGDVAISSDITVTASAANASADAFINGYGLLNINIPMDSGATQLGGGDILVTASATGASADAWIYNTSGTVGSVDVSASGSIDNAELSMASLLVDVAAGEQLSIQTVSVSAASTGLGNSVAWVDLSGQSGGTTDVDGVISIASDIEVSATGDGDFASLDVNTGADIGHTQLGGGDITVTASDWSTDAALLVGGASGNLNTVTLEATGDDSRVSVDIEVEADKTLTLQSLTVEAASNLDSGQSAEVNVFIHGEMDPDADDAGTISVVGDISVTSAGSFDIATLNLNIENSDGQHAQFGGGDITVTASGFEALASAEFYDVNGTSGAVKVTASGESADAHLHIDTDSVDAVRGLSVTTLTVEAVSNYASADLEVDDDISISSHITVTASSTEASATMALNYDDSETTELGGGNITVTASGFDAVADAYIDNANGTSGAIAVIASAESSDASLYLTTDAYNSVDGLTALSLSVTASGDTSYAGAFIMDDVAISGDITVTASASHASADAFINDGFVNMFDMDGEDGHTHLGGGDILVSASATGASADAAIYNAIGSVGSVDVRASGIIASGDLSWATLSLDVEVNETVTIQTVSVTAESDASSDYYGNSLAWGDLWGQSGGTTDADGIVSIVGDINVSAIGDHDDATLYVNSYGYATPSVEGDELGRTVLGGGNVAVLSSGDHASADAFIERTSGTAGLLSVTASGESADAYLLVTTETFNSVDGLAAQSLDVTSSGDSADTMAMVYGDVSFSQQVSVTASGFDSLSEAYINSYYLKSTSVSQDIGNSVFLSADIDVLASNSDALASLTVFNASGHLDSVDVTADGDIGIGRHSSACMDVYVNLNDTLTVQALSVTANTTSVSTDGHGESFAFLMGMESGDAEGTIVFSDSIAVSAMGEEDLAVVLASADIEFSGASNDITVTASGQSSDAFLALGGVSDVIETALVHTTAQDALGLISIMFEDRVTGDTGSIENLTIDAEHHRSQAMVMLEQTEYNGSVTVQGEGHAALVYYVDQVSATAETVDLSPMHSTSTSADAVDGEDLWGFVDFDLVALTGLGNQTSSESEVIAKSITMTGFNVDRDSINIRGMSSEDAFFFGLVGTSADLYRDDVHFYSDNTSMDVDSSEGAFTVEFDEYKEARVAVVDEAQYYFENVYSGDADLAFFYREVTFEFAGDRTEVRSFLVYDFDAQQPGVSGLIELGETTGLTERNVTDRYSIIHDSVTYDVGGGGSLDFLSLDGFHVIDHLTVSSSSVDAENLQMYSFDSNDVISLRDITVSAVDSSDAALVLVAELSADVILRQSDIMVSAGISADAFLSIDGVWGTVSSLTVEADSGSFASVDIRGISSEVDGDYDLDFREIDLRAQGEDSQLDVYIANANFGGDVLISGSTENYGQTGSVSNVVNLTFEGGTAHNITIDNTGRTVSMDALSPIDDTIELNLAILVADADNNASLDTWTDKIIHIEGWTMNDSLGFASDAGIVINEQEDFFGSLQDLFTAAHNSLEGTGQGNAIDNDFYFGIFDGDGYFFFVADESGLTTVIQLVGVTEFDESQRVSLAI